MSFVAQYALSGAFSLYLGYKSYSSYYSNIEFEELIQEKNNNENNIPTKETESSDTKETESSDTKETDIDNNCDKIRKTNLIVTQMTNDFFKKNLEETRKIKKRKNKRKKIKGNKKDKRK